MQQPVIDTLGNTCVRHVVLCEIKKAKKSGNGSSSSEFTKNHRFASIKHAIIERTRVRAHWYRFRNIASFCLWVLHFGGISLCCLVDLMFSENPT